MAHFPNHKVKSAKCIILKIGATNSVHNHKRELHTSITNADSFLLNFYEQVWFSYHRKQWSVPIIVEMFKFCLFGQ